MATKNPIVLKGVSVNTACAELNVCRDTINRLLGDGTLEGVKLGRKILITRDSIDQYWNSLPSTYRDGVIKPDPLAVEFDNSMEQARKQTRAKAKAKSGVISGVDTPNEIAARNSKFSLPTNQTLIDLQTFEAFIERMASEISQAALQQCQQFGPGMAACALRVADIINKMVWDAREAVRKPKDVGHV